MFPHAYHGVNTPVYLSTTFEYEDPDHFAPDFADGPPEGRYLYARFRHPNGDALGRALAAIDGYEAGYPTASGMSAVRAVVEQLMHPGARFGVSDKLYGGTKMMWNMYVARFGVRVDIVDVTDEKAVARFCRKKDAVAFFAESLSNPECVPLSPEVLEIARRHNVVSVVDNTFLHGCYSPFTHGADIVVYSLTKAACGTSRRLGGAILGSAGFIRALTHPSTGALVLHGGIMDPSVASEIESQLPTLRLRAAVASGHAWEFARIFSSHGYDVRYPGFSPEETALGVASYGGVLSVVCKDYEEARRLLLAMRNGGVGRFMVSLGSTHTYLMPFGGPSMGKLAPVWEKPLPFAAAPQGLVRIAVGHGDHVEKEVDRLPDVLDKLMRI